tara:strand:+ start:468 stop:632 length:165 start_codon:yes stop_codon:yes gene_type:complete
VAKIDLVLEFLFELTQRTLRLLAVGSTEIKKLENDNAAVGGYGRRSFAAVSDPE